MKEVFAIPCAGALIERTIDGEPHLLLQIRQKENDHGTNGLLEIAAGKIREYETVFDTLRREVKEETGLTVTKIHGEEDAFCTLSGDVETLSFTPFCVTQNRSGAYSIILHTFLCEAEGEPLASTNETQDIRWMKASEVKALVQHHPERFFFMHLNALRKYYGL